MLVPIQAYAESDKPQTADSHLVESAIRFFYAGDYLNAVHRFEEALKKNPSAAVLHSYAGFSYAKLGRYQESETNTA